MPAALHLVFNCTLQALYELEPREQLFQMHLIEGKDDHSTLAGMVHPWLQKSPECHQALHTCVYYQQSEGESQVHLHWCKFHRYLPREFLCNNAPFDTN